MSIVQAATSFVYFGYGHEWCQHRRPTRGEIRADSPRLIGSDEQADDCFELVRKATTFLKKIQTCALLFGG